MPSFTSATVLTMYGRCRAFIFIATFASLCLPVACTQAQDLGGRWLGWLSVGKDTARYYFEVNWVEEEMYLQGASLLAPRTTCTFTASASATREGQTIYYKEGSIIKRRGTIKASLACLKEASLSLERGNGKLVLSGVWKSSIAGYEGKIYLSKDFIQESVIPFESLPKITFESLATVANGDMPESSPQLRMTIVDCNTEQLVPAWIEVSSLPSKTLVYRHPAEGRWEVSLPQGEYELFIDRRGFHHQHLDIAGNRDTLLVFQLAPAMVGDVRLIEDLSFEQSKAVMVGHSERALGRLVRFMEENPLLSIRIAGHTDDVGNAYLNRKLSLERAEEVVRYLMQKGISPSRLDAIGFGETQPIVPNTSDENRAKNRRVAFEITKKE